MPNTEAVAYYTLFPVTHTGMRIEITLFLLELEILASQMVMLSYLTLFKDKHPTPILRKLQITFAFSICAISALLSEFIDSPPLICWLSQWESIALNLQVFWLSLDLFKTFSVMGGHFSLTSITQTQRASLVAYFLWASSQYYTLANRLPGLIEYESVIHVMTYRS